MITENHYFQDRANIFDFKEDVASLYGSLGIIRSETELFRFAAREQRLIIKQPINPKIQTGIFECTPFGYFCLIIQFWNPNSQYFVQIFKKKGHEREN